MTAEPRERQIDKIIVHGTKVEQKERAVNEVIGHIQNLIRLCPLFTGSLTVNFCQGVAKDIEKWERTKI